MSSKSFPFRGIIFALFSANVARFVETQAGGQKQNDGGHIMKEAQYLYQNFCRIFDTPSPCSLFR